MDGGTEFGLAIHQNPYLSTADRELHAVLTATGQGGAPAADRAEVIVIDCSGSMANPPTKIAAARRATAAAIDVLEDGVHFAIVQGTHRAELIYPAYPPMATATAQTREEAKAAVAGLVAAGGTAIGGWLTRAGELLSRRPSAIGHVLLLTDGRNEHETRDELAGVLAACKGAFVCDARGIGDGWEPKELMWIAEVLQGTATAVRQPAELTDDFRATMRAAMAKTVPEVRIRVRAMPWARVAFLKQVHPTIVDLAEHRVAIDERTVEFATGSWGEESREYHLCLELDRADPPLGESVRAARIDVLAGDEPRAQPVAAVAHWTDDPVAFTIINPLVGHYTEQEELSHVMIKGCDAYQKGDMRAAQEHWARALELAAASRNMTVLRNLDRLVEVDAAGRLVRIRPDLAKGDRNKAELDSVYSSRYPVEHPPPPAPAAVRQKCPACGRIAQPIHRFCEQCGTDLSTDPDAAAAGEPAGRAGT